LASRHDGSNRLNTLTEGQVPQRLANVLLELADWHGKLDGKAVDIEPPVTREDLAGLTGTTFYTVSRVLSGWQAKGVLSSRRGRLRLEDTSRLRALARHSLTFFLLSSMIW
jgi:CRP/FNR family transcriptional regulator, nitrogen oxide reductase regulator